MPSEINSAFLYAQLEEIETIQNKRKKIWKQYYEDLIKLAALGVNLPHIPKYATNNAHMFYLVCRNGKERSKLIEHLKQNDINAVFHYICLHDSPYYKVKHDGREMPKAKRYEECLVRLPLWPSLTQNQVNRVTKAVISFFNNQNS